MELKETALQGLFVVDSLARVDHRGSFTRIYCKHDMESLIGGRCILQINHSRTNKVGAVRGLHYQIPPHAELKIVRCIRGRVFDIAVDLRRNSETFLDWHGEILAPDTGRAMLIPEGFAHGFQVLEESSELIYLHTALYNSLSEYGLSLKDPRLSINLPIPITDISERDASHRFLSEEFPGLLL